MGGVCYQSVNMTDDHDQVGRRWWLRGIYAVLAYAATEAELVLPCVETGRLQVWSRPSTRNRWLSSTVV